MSPSYRTADLRSAAGNRLTRMPWIHRLFLENLVRRSADDPDIAAATAQWLKTGSSAAEFPFYPARVLMHDTTCGPALVDLAAARSALAEAGGDPGRINPVLPVDVSTDHSVAVDHFADKDALAKNMRTEMERNRERYRFMKWATRALDNLTVHPPGTGIMHTINLERLASVVTIERGWAIPDTLIGTDSHTPMINGIGVLGWGVGGLEAEAVMLGMPVMMRIPDMVGVRLSGKPRPGILATDLALTLTEFLRRRDLSGRFVEFFGPGVSALSAGDRAVIANMAPEYGSTTGYFPIDDATLTYLSATGRPPEHIALVGDYAKDQGLWFDQEASPDYAETLDFDLGSVAPSLAGPKRPQDLLTPADVPRSFSGEPRLAIAAITSCTNTSDPRLTIAAGLLARKARGLGLAPPAWVKTSFAPGSPAAALYLRRSGLLDDMEALGFGIVGFGCTTCIGNSGPLAEMEDGVAVLSGNRNFPGRVHPQVEKAFLASPPMVIAYALAGHARLDISRDPIAAGFTLADLWPSGAEIDQACATALRPTDFHEAYERAEASPVWQALDAPDSELFPWDPASTYLRRPPFVTADAHSLLGKYLATPLLVLGDDISTDHISPAGAIQSGEAADYLIARGESPTDLNVFSSRRGNWQVMLRGMFTNPSVRNLFGRAVPPGHTIHAASNQLMPLWRAAELYAKQNVPLVLVAGQRYGMGSSRDWAAKGVHLLGVRAVLAQSFERIHRSNLVNMGILPLRCPPEMAPDRLGLTPHDRIEIDAAPDRLAPLGEIAVAVIRADGETHRFTVKAAVETALELRILAEGGMLPMILRQAGGDPR